MKTGILWDLDGTLLDTLQDLTDSVNYVLTQFGCPVRTQDEVRRFVGNGAFRLIELSLPGKADDPDPNAVLLNFQQHYRINCQNKTCPYEGILQVLELLGSDYPMAIVSNKPDGAVKKLCQMYFPGVYALGELPGCPRKPAPDMLWKAMRDIGADRCVYVGDSEVDVRTAKNAGVPCLSVTWGFRQESQLLDAGAARLCHDPRELPRVLQAIIKETEEL